MAWFTIIRAKLLGLNNVAWRLLYAIAEAPRRGAGIEIRSFRPHPRRYMRLIVGQ